MEGRTDSADRIHDRRPTEPGARKRPTGGLPLGRLFGIEVVVDWSLLVIFALVAFSLGSGVLATWHPDWSAALRWSVAIAAAFLFFFSVFLHELSHALVARANDIPVRRITLFIFGGVAHMEREPPSPRAELLMAAVGPLTSIVIGFAALFAGALLAAPNLEAVADQPEVALRSVGPAATLLLWLGPVNVVLGVFNLVPGFPLDGGRVLRAFLWWATRDLHRATFWASRVGQGFAWGLMTLGVAMAFGIHVPLLGGGIGQGIWLLLIGWFLNNAAKASYRQMLVTEALEHVHVSDIMRRGIATVPPTLPIADLVRDYIMVGDQRAFPVVMNERLVGLICFDDVRRVGQDAWPSTRVADVMTPGRSLTTVRSDDEVVDALRALAQRDVDQVPVVEDGRVLGLLRRQDIMKWLALRSNELAV